MKKPWWLRLVGWVDIAAWVLTAAFLYRLESGHGEDAVVAGLFLFAFVAVVVGAVWFILSALLWGMNRQARTSAAVLRDAMAAKGKAERAFAHGANGASDPAPAPGSIVPKCSLCNAASIVFCHHHKDYLCWKHCIEHDASACFYTLTRRMALAGGTADAVPQAMPTSPFSGIR